MSKPELDDLINQSKNESSTRKKWSQPEIYDCSKLNDQVSLEQALRDGRVRSVVDQIGSIAVEIFEMDYPDLTNNDASKKEFVNDIESAGNEYGRWVLFPWSSELVRFPDPNKYMNLRTYRYRDLITAEEQAKLSMSRAAIFGMSVGGNLAISLVRNGMVGAIALGDYDYPSVSNIGRANINLADLGTSKVDIVAKNISYIDPFLQQKHFSDGFEPSMLQELSEFNPHVVADEIDHMPSSARIRSFCRDSGSAYINVSDVHDRAVLEVCRHDLGKSPLYAGRINDDVADKLTSGRMSEADESDIFARTVGLTNLTPRLIESSVRVGEDLNGIPQLGSTALIAAGFATMAYREIILGKNTINTGVASLKPDKVLGIKPKLSDVTRAFVAYKEYTK